MDAIQPNEGPQPIQAESSTRKRKRTHLPILICQVLLVLMVTKRTSSVVDAATAMVQARRTWTLINAHFDLIEFLLRHAHLLAELGAKRRRIDSLVAGTPNRSHVVIQEIVDPPQPPTRKLKFVGPLKEPIFTNRKLTHKNNKPHEFQLEVQLIDIETGKICTDLSPLKVEIVVISGNFSVDDQHAWTSDGFDKSILTARSQKGPLIVGKNLVEELKDGRAIFKDLMITDISKNFQSQTFRLGVRIVQSANFPRIQEACTEDFRVRNCRGEKDRKYEIPSLDDEVWRLNNIGKNGNFHKRMSSFVNAEGVSVRIETVGDFLYMLNADFERLKSTLKMKENQWHETVEHAKKAYMVPGETSLLNPVGNEIERNPAAQASVPIVRQETPLENMVVSPQSVSQTNSRFDQNQTVSFPTNPTFNQGHVFVRGKTSAINSGGFETDANSCSTSYSTDNISHYIRPENTGVLQQTGGRANCLVVGGPSMFISGRDDNPMPQFPLHTADQPHPFQNTQVDPPTDIGMRQISRGLQNQITRPNPTVNEDEATPQEEEPSMNQYIDGELPIFFSPEELACMDALLRQFSV